MEMTLNDFIAEAEQRPKWKEQRERKKQKRIDVQDQKNAGIYVSPRELYEDEHREIRRDIEVPNWFKALHKAWNTKSKFDMRHFNSFHDKYLNKPRTTPLPPKRSDQMRALLKENGVTIGEDGFIEGFENVLFMPNGRIHFKDEDLKISAYQFIKEYL